MKQLFMDVKTGNPIRIDVPAPACKKNGVLVETFYSLVSAGTERSLIDFGRKGLLAKCKERPDQVKKVLDKMKTDGALTTLKMAFGKLDEPLPLGYSSMGRVLEVGTNVTDVKVGDFVACAGLTAGHAEVNYVPRNLLVKLPEGFEHPEQAAFVALGSIAMQGIRQSEAAFGDWVAVIGLGLLGQLAVRILHAAGCRVIGIDLDESKAQDAIDYIEAFVKSDENAANAVLSLTGHGVDSVVITAATSSNQPVELAAEIARDRAIISMVGVTSMDIPRRPFYEKELHFRLSRSYGPGRYDSNFEDRGIDYPIGYVKWTERRNMEEFIRLIAQKKIDLGRLVTHTFDLDQAEKAYELITDNPDKERYTGVLVKYAENRQEKRANLIKTGKNIKPVDGKIRVGLIGAGNFVRSVILPNMSKIPEYEFIGLATSGSASSGQVLKKYGFRYATTDYKNLLADPDIDLIVIATPHNSHAPLAVEALDAGKHVYVEKPLAITMEQLEEVKAAYERNSQHLFVGFNRRYSPFTKFIKEEMKTDQYPCMIQYTVNAGQIPADHWVQDPEVGGGRIIGECCHFIDFCMFLTGSTPKRVTSSSLELSSSKVPADNVSINLEFENGSVANIIYTSLGAKSYPKEQVKVFCNGQVGEITNYANAMICGYSGKKNMKKMEQDKGFVGEYWMISTELQKTKKASALWLGFFESAFFTLRAVFKEES